MFFFQTLLLEDGDSILNALLLIIFVALPFYFLLVQLARADVCSGSLHLYRFFL